MDTDRLLGIVIDVSKAIAVELANEQNLDMVDVKLKQLKKVNEVMYVTIERKNLENLLKRGLMQ